MAERGDDVLSLSDQDGSALSDFSGFDPEEVVRSAGTANKSDVVTAESHRGKKGNKGPGKTKPNESKKGKNKAPKKSAKNTSSNEKSSDKQSENSVFGVKNLTQHEILQLREILGFNNRDEGPSVFDLYGDRPDNLIIEREYDGPSSDVEIVPDQPVRSLDKQLKDALFANESVEKENEPADLANEFSWQLPKLKTPKKGDAVSPSLASLIDTACTSQCEIDEIISKYKIPSNCEKMGAPSVNPEIWSDIVRKAQTYDKAFQDIQTLISIGMVPILKLVKLMKSHMSEEAQTSISDAITLLGQAQFNISIRRRYMIRPFLKKKYSALCNLQTPITSQLFGDDLNKEIKRCDTSVSVAREHYGPYTGFRGQSRGRARGRGYSYRGYSNANPSYSQYPGYQYGGRGYARFHPYSRQQPQYRQAPQFPAPKRGAKTVTVASPNEAA
ncbi:MAG: hypothetical protein N0E48_25110 [Candidatus Thiodiazotropha endolucinida]|nr:hypothetical protein [Candidatus Thiodiazotropha taylori]MCW4346606.1 hypothetical protein [Candidatus Thiodiazotropha endolucinida]